MLGPFELPILVVFPGCAAWAATRARGGVQTSDISALRWAAVLGVGAIVVALPGYGLGSLMARWSGPLSLDQGLIAALNITPALVPLITCMVAYVCGPAWRMRASGATLRRRADGRPAGSVLEPERVTSRFPSLSHR